jgi:dTMP kinase
LRTKIGVFICVEGIDGSGKTTQSRLLVKNLRKKGFDTVYTAEPSQGVVGKFIKKTILHGEKRNSVIIEALLFAADRVDHLEREVKPALGKGMIVICDRYLYSSLAYQGAAGLDLNWIQEINKWAIQPHLSIFIDVPPEVVIKRLNRKKSVMETIENQRKVREVYMRLVEEKKLVLVDGNKPINEVAKEILNIVLEHLRSEWKLHETV